MRWLRSVSNWGLCPQTPGIYRFPARIAVLLRNWGLRPQTPPHHCREAIAEGRRQTAPRVIPAAESALGLRPRIALSSAQVFPEWTTSTSPCNNFSPNGDYPLNFLSHVWGSLHTSQNLSSLAALCGLPLVGPELHDKFGVDKTS